MMTYFIFFIEARCVSKLYHFKEFILAKKIIVLKKKVKHEESKTKESPLLASKFLPNNNKNSAIIEENDNQSFVGKIDKVEETKFHKISAEKAIETVPTADIRTGHFLKI